MIKDFYRSVFKHLNRFVLDNKSLFVILILLSLSIVIILPSVIAPNTVGLNYKNVTVITQVNITNSRPEVLAVAIYDTSNLSLNNITISAGSTKSVTCNASLRDWNGFSDIVIVNATLYYHLNSSNQSDDNNVHYTNSSCNINASSGTFTGNFACGFNVLYYANNGTWICNVTAYDIAPSSGYGSNTTYFYAVYALNLTDGINYGNMAVDEFSPNITANITNFGNRPINVTVRAYGAIPGDGLAMNCSLGGNITIANQRFSASDVDWASKTTITGTATHISGLTMSKQTTGTRVVNTTYWQLYTNSANNPGGLCTGYVVFSAEAP